MLSLFRKLLKEQHRIFAVYLLAICALAISPYIELPYFKLVSLLLFFPALVLVAYRFLYLLNIRKFRRAAAFMGVVTAMTVFGLGVAAYRLFIDPMTVSWKEADLKGRSAELPLQLGLESKRPDSILKMAYSQPHFQLYNYFRDGFYKYDVWLPKIDSGYTYLKGYLLNGDTLRSMAMNRNSRARVFNREDVVRRFPSNRYIVVTEGGWGPKFPARFEVWYHFSDKSRPDSLLMDKIYMIEGMGR